MSKVKNGSLLWILFVAGLVILVGFMWPRQADAQCGSSASSCKNCHEVQGEYPVNNDGTNWHEAHAFGDFCDFCHAGNVQATDAAAAHTGMEAPLDNIQASCGNCHAADTEDMAGIYAATLGVEIGAGSSGDSSGGGDNGSSSDDSPPPAESGGSSAAEPAPPASAAPPPAASSMVVEDPNTVDYVQRYNEVVLGIQPRNWGNILLIGLIGLVLVGGGAFVVWNERRLRRNRQTAGIPVPTELAQQYPEYAPEVVALLPPIARLSPTARADLFNMLQNPARAEQLLRDIARIEPGLVTQVRSLDPESRSLLLAMAGGSD